MLKRVEDEPKADKLQPRPVEEIEIAVRQGRMYERGNRVDNKLNVQGLEFASLRGHGVSSYTDERRYQLDRRSIGDSRDGVPQF